MPHKLPFELDGARVVRVDRPLPGLWALSLLGPARAGSARSLVLLLAAGPPRARGVLGLTDLRPRGEAADPSVRGVREKLESGRLTRGFVDASGVSLEVVRGDVAFWVSVDRRGVSVSPPIEGTLPEGRPLEDADLEAAWTRGASLAAEQERLLAEGARQAALASLRKLRERLSRRRNAIDADARAIDEAEARAAELALFVAEASRARPGARELVATDWSTGEPREIRLALDPARPAREQLDALFGRARRLRAGAKIAAKRIEETDAALRLVDAAFRQITEAPDQAAVAARLATLARVLPGDVRLPSPPRDRARRSPHGHDASPAERGQRRFWSRTGTAILVGKDAASNDALTRQARPGDLWLHAKDARGSHVVVPGWYREGRLDQDTLLDAATLAAHFSAERGELLVDVQYVDRRHVRKRKGSAPGAVELSSEKVLPVRIEEDRLARLLATEGRDGP